MRPANTPTARSTAWSIGSSSGWPRACRTSARPARRATARQKGRRQSSRRAGGGIDEAFQTLDLRGLQIPPLAGLEPLERQAREIDAGEPVDWIADRLEQFPDLPFAAFVDLHLQARVAVAAPQDHDPSRGRFAAFEEDPVTDLVQVRLCGIALDPGLIALRDPVARVGQLEGQIAVVREQQRAFGVEVEPPDRIDPGGQMLEQVH